MGGIQRKNIVKIYKIHMKYMYKMLKHAVFTANSKKRT